MIWMIIIFILFKKKYWTIFMHNPYAAIYFRSLTKYAILRNVSSVITLYIYIYINVYIYMTETMIIQGMLKLAYILL